MRKSLPLFLIFRRYNLSAQLRGRNRAGLDVIFHRCGGRAVKSVRDACRQSLLIDTGWTGGRDAMTASSGVAKLRAGFHIVT